MSSKELKDKYPDDFNEDAIQAIKNATEQTMDSFIKVVEEKSKEMSKTIDKDSDTASKTTARRGRKPKKKYEDLVNEVIEENRRMAEEDSEDYEDSLQNDELIVDES